MASIRTIPLKAGVTPGVGYEVIQLHKRAGAVVVEGDAIATLRANGISFVIETWIAGRITDDLVWPGMFVDGGDTICNIAVLQPPSTILSAQSANEDDHSLWSDPVAFSSAAVTVQMQFGVDIGPENYLKILTYHKTSGDRFAPGDRLVSCYVKANGGKLSYWLDQGVHETSFSLVAACHGVLDIRHLQTGAVIRGSVIMLTARIADAATTRQQAYTEVVYHCVNRGESIVNEADIPYGVSLKQQQLLVRAKRNTPAAADPGLQSWRSRKPRAHTLAYETIALTTLGLSHPEHYDPQRDIRIGSLRIADCPAALESVLAERNRRFGRKWAHRFFQQVLTPETAVDADPQSESAGLPATAGELFSADERRRWYGRSTIMAYRQYHECVGQLTRLKERVDLLKSDDTSDAEWFFARYFDDTRYTQDYRGYLTYLETFHPTVSRFIGEPLPVLLPREQLHHHVLISGSDGSGKSALLQQLISEQIRSGQSAVMVLDTRGRVATAIARWCDAVPAESGGRERLIYIKAGDPDARPALALLNPEQLIGQRKVLVCDLSPDQQQSGAAAALEHQLLLKLRAFALQREQRPAGQRLPLYIYINEGFAEIPNDIEAIFDKPEQCHIYLTLCQQPPPQDQGEAWTRTLARLTRTQFTGYCGDASSYRRLGEISRTAPGRFTGLQPYQWLVTHTGEAAEAGRRPPLLLTLSPAMADQHHEG